jgi:hypothetical protein
LTGNEILLATARHYSFFKKSGDEATNLDWINEIATSLYEDLQKISPEAYISEETYTLAVGTDEYDLPTDFDNISVKQVYGEKVFANYETTRWNNLRKDRYMILNKGVLCGFFKFDSDGQIVDIWQYTGKGSNAKGFWINDKDSKLVITPADHSETEDHVLRYIPLLTEITDLDSGDIFMPRGGSYKWQQFWVEALKEMWARDIDKNPMKQAEFSQAKKGQFDRILFESSPNKTRIITT